KMTTRRRAFKLGRSQKSQRINSDTVVVTKGGTSVRISVAEFRQCLQRLRKVQHLRIRDLTDNPYADPTNPGGPPLTGLNSDLKQIIRDVNVLYPTQFFPMIHGHIREIFGDVSDVRPGTIGAYMVGCLLPTSSSQPQG